MEDGMFGVFARPRSTRVILPAVSLIGALAVGACGDDNGNFIIISPTTPPVATVVTFHDSTFNFTSLRTFAMPDSIVQFNPVTGTPVVVTRTFDQVALNQVRSDLVARGFTDVTGTNQQPSFIVLVGASAMDNYNAFVSYPWFASWGFSPVWSFFAPGFDNSWGINFPWFSSVGATNFPSGSLVVTMIPTASVDPANKTITAVWSGVATGLLNGGTTSDVVQAAVNEMFRQSPFLVPGPTP
jgi:hypothetical protein